MTTLRSIVIAPVIACLWIARAIAPSARTRSSFVHLTCKKHGKRLCWACVGQTPWFLFEHTLWEKVPPFVWVTHALGL